MSNLLKVHDLYKWFDTASWSLFRLETLDFYEPDRQEYERWLAGEPLDMTGIAAWHQLLRAERERGLHRSRVHALRSPLGPYLRFECELYAGNVEAGEQISILDLAERPQPEGLIDEDFWLKDDAEVLLMHYGGGGSFLGGEVMPPGTLPRYLRARDAALEAAEPLESWWAAHPQYHRDR